MLKRIVDKSKLENNEVIDIENCLEIDLKRMDSLDHRDKPFFANAYKIIAKNGMFTDSIIYEIQYGIKIFGNFYQLDGSSSKFSHEDLPFLTN